MIPVIETKELSKVYDGSIANDSVSLAFQAGKIHAVLGENGAGKSTLMKLLFGLIKPTSGEIRIDGKAVEWRNSMDAIRAGLGMVQQHFSLVEPLSVIDNIMIGAEVTGRFGQLNRTQAIKKMESILPGPQLAVPWLTPVSELSVGFRQRVEILKLLFRDARVLFLDEPTAVLTPQEINDFFSVLRVLRDEGRTIILITHKIGEVFSLCDTYTVLRRGRVTATGLVADATPEQLVESMIGRKMEGLPSSRSASGSQSVLSALKVSQRGDERGKLRNISLQLKAGEVLGIAGVEGSGQSAFVDAVMGLVNFDGEILVLGNLIERGDTDLVRDLGVGLIPEDRNLQGLWADESCHANAMIGLENQFVSSGIFSKRKLVSTTETWMKQLDVRAPSYDVPVLALSGGNQQKIIFAREVKGRMPKVLICHQPTRGIDLGAIELIHRQLLELRDKGLGILLISSELDELIALSDRIVVFFEGKSVREFIGGSFDKAAIGSAMTGVTHV